MFFLRLTLFVLGFLLTACSNQQPPRPPETVPPNPVPVRAPLPVIEVDLATGVIPRPEPLSASGNRDYQIGKSHIKVWRHIKDYRQEGKASWIAKRLDGNRTANGEKMNSHRFTAAHRNLPLPSYVRVTNLDNGRKTIVRVNDRGPFGTSRLIDLSYAAAKQLDMVKRGEARVRLELITDSPDKPVERVPMQQRVASKGGSFVKVTAPSP